MKNFILLLVYADNPTAFFIPGLFPTVIKIAKYQGCVWQSMKKSPTNVS
jgi:hypothetical protein